MLTNTKCVVKIEFDDDKKAKEFLTWLCEQGEQDYWYWMNEGDQEHQVTFDYWNGGKKFCPDLTVTTKPYKT